MLRDFKPEIKLFVIVVLIAVVVSVGGILLLKTLQSAPSEQQVFVSQEECEGKTGKRCFLFRGLCQVMVPQNATEKEENARFLNDCQEKIGTWQPTEERLQVDTPLSVPSEVQGVYPEPIEGWQTYRNDEFGFEVKYPIDWIFNELEDRVVFKEVGKEYGFEGTPNIGAPFVISVEDMPSQFNTIEEYALTLYRPNYNDKMVHLQVGGVQAVQLSDYLRTEIVFFHRGKLYRINVYPTYLGLGILSTFRFVE